MSDLMAKRHEENVFAEELERTAESTDAGARQSDMDGGAPPTPDAGNESNDTGHPDTSWARVLRICMAKPESYDVYVAWDGARYLVRIIPIIERCVRRGGHLFGGGARYEISGTDCSILMKHYDEQSVSLELKKGIVP